MLTLQQLQKLSKIFQHLYFDEEPKLFILGKQVKAICVNQHELFSSDMFDMDGTLQKNALEKLDFQNATAKVCFDKKDQYNLTEQWHDIKDEEINILYRKLSSKNKEQ